MFNDKNKKANKRMFIVTIVLVGASVISLLTSTNVVPGFGVARDAVSNIEYYIFKAPIDGLGNLASEYAALKDVYNENKKLKKSLDNYTRELAYNKQLEKELDDLKSITNIKNLPTEYTLSYTTVIKRDSEAWDSTVMINSGSQSGIKKGMAVMSANGMVGVITRVGAVSSEVRLLCTENTGFQLPVMIQSGKDTLYGLLNGYDTGTHCFKIQLLSTASKVETNAEVLTSGLGGSDKTPKGILVGNVKGFTNDNASTGKIIAVKPSADFDNLNYLAVVKRK